MRTRTALLIIDAQYDFCNPSGTLYVPGAEEDVKRIARLIAFEGDKIDGIFVTLDTHHALDIAHPLFWADPNGNTVAPFTKITAQAVADGRWIPRYQKEYVTTYLKQLEADGGYHHFIWPEHCLVGSKGASLEDTLVDAIMAWVHRFHRDYVAVVKGLNPLTEHFGVFRAQVPIESDRLTELNGDFIDQLNSFERILVAGEARSHCVATSIAQILNYAPALVPKVYVLTDCMSDVPGWGNVADPVFVEAQERGIHFTTSVSPGL
jgi:nicotinamidase/pyrazinamidase